MQTTIFNLANPMPRGIFAQLYSIMEYSFPKDERRDFDEQFAQHSNPAYNSAVLTEDEKVLGFLNFWQLSGFVYLEHFAVSQELRGKGIGSGLIKQICERHGNQQIILEAEPPALNEIAARRIEFYKRLGFILNDYHYLQPPYRKGDSPVELKIMSAKPLSEDDFEDKIRVLYREVYRTDENLLYHKFVEFMV